MTTRARLLLLALIVAAAVLATTRGGGPRSDAPAATTPSPLPPRAAPASAAPVDPASVRDLFRFAEPTPEPAGPPPRPAPAVTATAPPDLPKLVGLVRRQGRLLAAFSRDGEVLLAGPGETAAGVTVLEVSEEGVRVKRKDGSEERLRVP